MSIPSLPRRATQTLAAALCLAGAYTTQAYADAVVGTGSSASCNETALNSALTNVTSSNGGIITFNCGAMPVTITLTTQKSITKNTIIDGGGKITLDGNNAARHFLQNGADLTLKSLNLVNGNASGAGQIPAGSGGAIYASGASTLALDSVTLDNNHASTPSGYGGAIVTYNGVNVILNRVTATNNQAGYGGVIATYGSADTLALTEFVATDNHSNNGGGVVRHLGSSLSIKESLFASNSATGNGADGGAIEINPWATSSLDVSNSTFYDNGNATGSGGAISLDYVPTGTIVNSTFANNHGNGAIHTYGGNPATNSQLTLKNTIISSTVSNPNCSIISPTVLIDGGNNLQFGGSQSKSCGASIAEADPMLAALAYNGGFSDTMALQAGSPAIDAGNDASCTTMDQRSLARPQGAHCDIGAYEAPAAAVAPAITNGPPPNGTVGVAYNFTYTATGTTPIAFGVTAGSLPPGLTMSGAGVISGTPTTFGSYSATVTASNGTAPNATQSFTIVIAALPQPPLPAITVAAPSLSVWGMLSMIALLVIAGATRHARTERDR